MPLRPGVMGKTAFLGTMDQYRFPLSMGAPRIKYYLTRIHRRRIGMFNMKRLHNRLLFGRNCNCFPCFCRPQISLGAECADGNRRRRRDLCTRRDRCTDWTTPAMESTRVFRERQQGNTLCRHYVSIRWRRALFLTAKWILITPVELPPLYTARY